MVDLQKLELQEGWFPWLVTSEHGTVVLLLASMWPEILGQLMGVRLKESGPFP